MDVTPAELRDTDIKEAFRGYARDDVDELLERAAVALEHLTDRVQQLSGRVSDAENRAESSATRNRDGEDIIQRTMIMAQKAADDAVADADARARTILQDADARAAAVVNEAEARATAQAEAERQRVEAEVRDLAVRRDALSEDVETLERYRDDARGRVRQALEDELAGLERLDEPGAVRPELHNVAVPEPEEAVVRRDETWSATAPTAAIEAVEPFAPEPERSPGPVSFDDPELPADWTSGPVQIAGRDESAPQDSAAAYDFVEPDEPVEAEVLDDDAFFATLREAVSDEAPLHSREDEMGDFFDQDQTDPGPKRGRRRRRG
jgi:cell division septum initiation protein DivIVA